MITDLSFKDLKHVIDIAEKAIEQLEEKDDNKSKQKIKKINIALENGYRILNVDDTNQKEIDKATDLIWRAIEYDKTAGIFWIFLFGFLFSSAVVFTAYQTYSFIDSNWDKHHHHHKYPELTEDISKLITVNYKETNIVNLTNLMTVSDSIGLKNPPQEFQISNDGKRVNNMNYQVVYSVNITELNYGIENILNKQYLKYQLSYTDNKGNTVTEPIGTFADLKENPDGTFLMTKGIQKKNATTDFKVVIWLSATAPNSEQNKAYTFSFKVNAAIANV